MRNFAAKIGNIFKTAIFFLKTKLTPSTTFLKKGSWGAVILITALATFTLYNSYFYAAAFLIPTPVIYLILPAVFFLGCELINQIQKLFTKKSFRTFICFTACVILCNYVISFKVSLPFTLLTTLVADLLGRCLWTNLVKKNLKAWGGYIVIGLCLTYIGFGFFYIFSNNLGKDRVAFYNEMTQNFKAENPTETKTGFDNYLAEKKFETVKLSYGPSEENDIVTETIDLTSFAKRDSNIYGKLMSKYFKKDLDQSPIKGVIWLPKDAENCPILFIVHGNHDFTAPSYLGYEYMGNYLSSNGYAVVSVDENILNDLSDENDARAVLLLENMREIFKCNKLMDNPLFNKIDENKVAIAGHSRGGEMVATAYLFNSLHYYPNDGEIVFDFNFNISSIISIAPTVDQYMPADHAVKIHDVNYLYIHGANDQDVNIVMAEKQYNNVTYSENASSDFFKANVYILGANHGQFNSEWGLFDSSAPTKHFLNVAHFISEEDQQFIAKAYFKTFLDCTLLGKTEYKDLFYNFDAYRESLPNTIYQTNYHPSNFHALYSFDEDCDLRYGASKKCMISCKNFKSWNEGIISTGYEDSENFGLYANWKEQLTKPAIWFIFNDEGKNKSAFSFRLADNRNDTEKETEPLNYKVCLYDDNGNNLNLDTPEIIYPSLAVQLYKKDILKKEYEYKHQLQTVRITKEMIPADSDFDFSKICKVCVLFENEMDGSIIIDEVGFED